MDAALEELVRKQFIAEEAVRIVQRFNNKSSKKPRNERLVDLCTDIARILDVNKKLETTIKSQEAEINDLRGSGGISQTHDSALDSSSHTRESPPPQGLVRSPSSGRGTAYTLRETGTDPVFDWTERPETLSRATSPIILDTSSRATSPWHPYTSSRATSPLKSRSPSSSSTKSKDNLEKPPACDMSESLDTRDVTATEPDDTDKADEYQDDFQSESDTAQSNDENLVENEETTNETVTKKDSDVEESDKTADDHHHNGPRIEEAEKPNEEKQKENKQGKDKNKEKPSNRAGKKDSSSRREKDRSKRTSRASETKGTKKDVKEKPNRNTRTQEIKNKDTERSKSVSSATSTTRRKVTEERDNKEASKRSSAHVSSCPEKRSTQSADEKTNRNVNNKEDKKEDKKEDRKSAERKDTTDSEKRTKYKSRPRQSPYNSARKRSSRMTSQREGSGKSVHWYSSDESLSSSSSESEVDEEHTRKLRPELSTEYWDIHKLVKFLRVGNPTVTVIALCALHQEFNLEQEMTQVSMIDLDGISILLNLLKTDHRPCMIGSLKILRRLSVSRRVNNEIYRLGGIIQLIRCLSDRSIEIQSLAAGTLSNFVSFRKAYSAIKKYNGIPLLAKLLQTNKNTKPLRYRAYTNTENANTLCHNACNALWSCSRSDKNIEAIRNAGVVPILASLLRKGPSDVILSTVGIIQECSSDASFREEIRKEGIIEDVVGFLRKGEDELRTLCANAIFKCGDDEETQKLVQKHRGLDPLIQVVASNDNNQDKKLLGAVVGAIWKCASNKENLTRLEKFDTLSHLIRHLRMEQPHEVEANIIGALSEFAYNKRNVLTLYEEGVINIIIKKLNLTLPNILLNSTKLLALCAKENIPRQAILRSDGVRLLWSLLKSPNHKVVANAAYGIAMCVSDAKESAEIVRSFVGGLELVTNLLRSNKREVLINTCRLVINIGQDRENMSIMTDYDAVPLLISLVYADDEEMRQYVAEAIATCCNLEKNITSLSSTVIPLSEGFALYKSVQVHRTTALALEKLSQDPHNCYLIHKHGALKHLMKMIGSEDADVQEAAARCIKNVRMNAIDQNS